MAADVAVLAAHVAAYLHVAESDLIVRDHTHEGLSAGAWSIAHEGGQYDWPYLYTEAAYAGTVPETPRGWHLEAVNGCCLAAYPIGWYDAS